MVKRGITIEREVLLFEIDRRCSFNDCTGPPDESNPVTGLGRGDWTHPVAALPVPCNARNSIGLTKPEAREYSGFECNVCERWNKDQLSQKDIPDWWDELATQVSSNDREQ